MNILEQIVADKKKEVAIHQESISIEQLQKSKYYSRKTISISHIISENINPSVIAEFKRKSPSISNINLDADIMDVTGKYEANGASALSILTDEKYFGGSNRDVLSVRDLTKLPILRKEFIINEYQIIESKSIGADCILLIAECLSKIECMSLAKLANDIGLEVLLEIHSDKQLEKINDNIQLIGVNNRNLTTFKTDIETSMALIEKLPHNIIRVSESGIKNIEEIKKLYEVGFDAFLIGESMMHNPEFIKSINLF